MSKAKPLMGRAVRAMLRLQAHNGRNLIQHQLEQDAIAAVRVEVTAWAEIPHARGIGPSRYVRQWTDLPNQGMAAEILYERETGYWSGVTFTRLGYMQGTFQASRVELLQKKLDSELAAYGVRRFG